MPYNFSAASTKAMPFLFSFILHLSQYTLFNTSGTPKENRTPLPAVKGRCPNR